MKKDGGRQKAYSIEDKHGKKEECFPQKVIILKKSNKALYYAHNNVHYGNLCPQSMQGAVWSPKS